MQGQKVLIVGGQGPVSFPLVQRLAPDNDVHSMARFTDPAGRERLEALGVTCIVHDIFEPFDALPNDFDHVYFSALPMSSVTEPLGVWPSSYDAYAVSAGRLMAHFSNMKSFVAASSISVYDPVGGDTPVKENHPFGFHTHGAYSFTKVAMEAVISFQSLALNIPTTILRVGSASSPEGGPMKDRLDLLVQDEPIRLNPDKPTYYRPLFPKDAGRFSENAFAAARVPPLVVNWCGDDLVSVEEYCEFMGSLIGKEPTFEYTTAIGRGRVPDITLRTETLGAAEVRWQDGCRELVEACYPELVK